MAASNSTEQPAWQRTPVFEFFASLKLAVVLLAVLIIAVIAGTIYESSFDANVARAYVYGAPWFNLWLVLLGANLTASALSRWPWRKHHLAFLITHLGIITLLIGSLIGRIWGTEGTITLFTDRRLRFRNRRKDKSKTADRWWCARTASTLRVVTTDGQTATGSCWMNNPFSYPGAMVAHMDWPHTKSRKHHGTRKISDRARCRFRAIPAGS
jgi:hypothetical protein